MKDLNIDKLCQEYSEMLQLHLQSFALCCQVQDLRAFENDGLFC